MSGQGPPAGGREVPEGDANTAIGYGGLAVHAPGGLIAGGTQIFAKGGDDLLSGGVGNDTVIATAVDHAPTDPSPIGR